MNNDDRAKVEALTVEQLRDILREGSLVTRGAALTLAERVHAALASAQAASAEPVAPIEASELEDMARIACEEALAFGIGLDSFHRLAKSVMKRCTTPAPAVAPAAVTLRPMQSDDGRPGYYADTPEFYCDFEQDENGEWSAFFRDRATGKEAFAIRTPEPQAERHLSKAEQGALRRALMRSAKFVDQEPQPDSRGQAREGWISVRDRIPQFQDGEDGLRVVVLTADHDFGGAQVHDIPASDFYAYDPDDDEPGTEVTKVATHWMPRHELIAASPTPDEQRAQAAQEDVTQAARDVLAERRRQVEAEGWTPEHAAGPHRARWEAATVSTAVPLHCDGCGLEIMNEICSNSASPERIYHPECFEKLGMPLTPWDEAAIRRIVREELDRAAAAIAKEKQP